LSGNIVYADHYRVGVAIGILIINHFRVKQSLVNFSVRDSMGKHSEQAIERPNLLVLQECR